MRSRRGSPTASPVPTQWSSAEAAPSTRSCASAGSSMADGVADLAAGVAAETPRPAGLSASAEAEDLGAPLYVAWQITNECNLACLHCIEESGPGKAFRDEL